MELVLITLLNGLCYGLLLFMLSAGLTLIFSMLGVLNFAHASFYMLGAYVAYAVSMWIGFWPALLIAPMAVGALGMAVERYGLRNLRRHGHMPELLFTYGLAHVIGETVQLIWGRAPVPYRIPAALEGSLFMLYDTTFPVYRGFMMLVAVLMLVTIRILLKRSRTGLVIQAALTHPETVEALGHDVPRIAMLVFGGGCALAGLAGVIGGNALVTEPSMGATLGSITFVVAVVGGLGSLTGAFVASLLIGLLQTAAVAIDYSLRDFLAWSRLSFSTGEIAHPFWDMTIAQTAPMLPYLLMIALLICRPAGLMGTREK
ncbi:MAG: branched-chain amino acid ABC transporter permease [Pseudomonadota bacterium]